MLPSNNDNEKRGGYRGVLLQSTAVEIWLLQATEFQKLPDYSLQF